MTGPLTLSFCHKVQLHLAQFRALAQKVVAHQAIEVERCGSTGMGLRRQDFGQCQRQTRGVLYHRIGGLDRRALRQVDHDGQFGFVVKR